MEKLILELKSEFPDNFTERGDNVLHIGHVPHTINPESAIEKAIMDLFDKHPKAKIARVSVAPSFEDDRGVTITIHGTF